MSQYGNQLNMTAISEDDMSAKQYYFVMVGTANNYVKLAGTPAAEGTHVVGVVQNKPAALEAADVAICGTTKVVCGANVSLGEKVMSSSGKAIPADADTKSVGGIALEANTAGDGGVIEILLTPGGVAQADESN